MDQNFQGKIKITNEVIGLLARRFYESLTLCLRIHRILCPNIAFLPTLPRPYTALFLKN